MYGKADCAPLFVDGKPIEQPPSVSVAHVKAATRQTDERFMPNS
jgi:hypothetical protein